MPPTKYLHSPLPVNFRSKQHKNRYRYVYIGSTCLPALSGLYRANNQLKKISGKLGLNLKSDSQATANECTQVRTQNKFSVLTL